jgi:hypothetical protein
MKKIMFLLLFLLCFWNEKGGSLHAASRADPVDIRASEETRTHFSRRIDQSLAIFHKLECLRDVIPQLYDNPRERLIFQESLFRARGGFTEVLDSINSNVSDYPPLHVKARILEVDKTIKDQYKSHYDLYVLVIRNPNLYDFSTLKCEFQTFPVENYAESIGTVRYPVISLDLKSSDITQRSNATTTSTHSISPREIARRFSPQEKTGRLAPPSQPTTGRLVPQKKAGRLS